MERFEFVVQPEQAGERLDRFLAAQTGLSRSALQQLMEQGGVLYAGKPAAKNQKIQPGISICVEVPEAQPLDAVPQDIPVDIVYEDEHLLVVNKPKGGASCTRQPGRYAGKRAAVSLCGAAV